MPVRLLLILSLVLQPLLLAAASGRAMPAECERTSCCTVVEKTTCCGETVVETFCRRSGGTCLCGVQDDADPAPAPAPTPDRTDLSSLVLVTGSVPALLPPPSASRTLTPPATGGAARSHNETQALLCIWRT